MEDTVRISFRLPRDIYNRYKRIVSDHGENGREIS